MRKRQLRSARPNTTDNSGASASADNVDESPSQIARVSVSSGQTEPDLVTRRETGTPLTNETEMHSLLEEARVEITALRSQLVSMQANNVTPIQSENRYVNWNVFKDDRLIPEFDPSDLTQNIDDWLCKVNECAVIYHWDDVAKIYIALGKLKGTARIWYDGLKTMRFAWPQWESMLREMFPSKNTFGKLFYDAATYRAATGQDLNDYCFRKLSKLNQLNLNLTQAQIVDCVIEGINDVQTKVNIRAARCSTFVELADYVTNFPCSSSYSKHTAIKSETVRVNLEKNYKSNSQLLLCFGCNEAGHKRAQCPKRTEKQCTYCRRFGHTFENCKTKLKGKNNTSKDIKYVGQNKINKYSKKARIRNKIINCTIDMGSELTLIKYSVAKEIGLKLIPLNKEIMLRGFNGTQVRAVSKSLENIQIEGVSVETEIIILDDAELIFDLLIGQNFIDHPTVLIINNSKHLIIMSLPDLGESTPCLSDKYSVNIVTSNDPNNKTTEWDNITCGNISENEKKQLKYLLDTFKDRFAFKTSDLGKTSTVTMNIECITDKPIVYRPYRLSLTERQDVQTIISELLQSNIIRPSNSPYASPILLVSKKDGGKRMCCDFRAINKITKKNKYPLPLIQDQIDRLGGHQYFITLDLSQGFYQICMEESSIEKTAFVTPDGHFEFLRLPFGLANAPSVFQRLMNLVLADYINSIAQVYIDDIIIPAKSFNEGLERLKLVLERLKLHNLTLKLSKCSFFFNKN